MEVGWLAWAGARGPRGRLGCSLVSLGSAFQGPDSFAGVCVARRCGYWRSLLASVGVGFGVGVGPSAGSSLLMTLYWSSRWISD